MDKPWDVFTQQLHSGKNDDIETRHEELVQPSGAVCFQHEHALTLVRHILLLYILLLISR